MLLIRDVVRDVMSTQCLTVELEDQLRELLQQKYDREDFKAFMRLQEAVCTGEVRQESRELLGIGGG